MKDYSVYNITPPSLFILADGPNVYMCGMNDNEKEKIKSIFENLIYDAEIAFYYNDNPTTDETLAWTEVVTARADFVLVNVDNVTVIEQHLIDTVLTNGDDDAIIIYYSKSGIDNPMARLLASNGQKVIFNISDLESFLKMLFESE